MEPIKIVCLQVLWLRVQESNKEWHVIIETERLKIVKDEGWRRVGLVESLAKDNMQSKFMHA